MFCFYFKLSLSVLHLSPSALRSEAAAAVAPRGGSAGFSRLRASPGHSPARGHTTRTAPPALSGGGVSEATTSAIITITIITIKCNGESRVRSVGVFGGAARNAVLLFGFFLVVVAAAVGLVFFFAVRKRGFVPEPSRGKKCLSPLGLLGPELRARQNRASAGGNFANPGVITAGPH